jgi:hypothetical protein
MYLSCIRFDICKCVENVSKLVSGQILRLMVATIDCLAVVSGDTMRYYQETVTQLTKYETARYPGWYVIVEVLEDAKSSKGC